MKTNFNTVKFLCTLVVGGTGVVAVGAAVVLTYQWLTAERPRGMSRAKAQRLQEHSVSSSDDDDTDGDGNSKPTPQKSYPLRKEVKVEEQKVGERTLFTSIPTAAAADRGSKQFPGTLKDFGYYFNTAGELRQTSNDEPFQFAVKPGDADHNQRRYEALGDVITDHIYELLQTRCGLVKTRIPVDAAVGGVGATTFIFHSPEAFSGRYDTLLVLIHGAGVVRAGQWARRLIINDCLDSGTQIPYIERALKLGYGVLVMNTNDNRVVAPSSGGSGERSPRLVTPKGVGSPESHALYVWSQFIRPAPALRHIAIVAHSYGGVVTASLLREFPLDVMQRVFAIAFTDSVHGTSSFTKDTLKWIQQRGVNWVTSSEPLDTPLGGGRSDVPRLSAGHIKHEMTSWSSFHSVFAYIERRLTETKSKETQSSAGDQPSPNTHHTTTSRKQEL